VLAGEGEEGEGGDALKDGRQMNRHREGLELRVW
jgi:hypothetical protein